MLKKEHEEVILVADIGGTNARFGIVAQHDGNYRVDDCEQLLCDRFASFSEALGCYLHSRQGLSPSRLVISLAGPVRGNRAAMTNLDWSFDAEHLRDEFALESVSLIHDLMAQALAIPLLSSTHIQELRAGERDPSGIKAVIGLGTGLGIAYLNVAEGRYQPNSGEGGHASFAPRTELEKVVYDYLQASLGYVSLESLLSGPGLVNIYQALAAAKGCAFSANGPKEVISNARDASDPLCAQALEIFIAVLGNVAGNTALTLGAGGGVYLTGGLTKHLLPFLQQERFYDAFSATGFRSQYLEDIPIYAVTHPYAGLLGAAALLK